MEDHLLHHAQALSASFRATPPKTKPGTPVPWIRARIGTRLSWMDARFCGYDVAGVLRRLSATMSPFRSSGYSHTSEEYLPLCPAQEPGSDRRRLESGNPFSLPMDVCWRGYSATDVCSRARRSRMKGPISAAQAGSSTTFDQNAAAAASLPRPATASPTTTRGMLYRAMALLQYRARRQRGVQRIRDRPQRKDGRRSRAASISPCRIAGQAALHAAIVAAADDAAVVRSPSQIGMPSANSVSPGAAATRMACGHGCQAPVRRRTHRRRTVRPDQPPTSRGSEQNGAPRRTAPSTRARADDRSAGRRTARSCGRTQNSDMPARREPAPGACRTNPAAGRSTARRR